MWAQPALGLNIAIGIAIGIALPWDSDTRHSTFAGSPSIGRAFPVVGNAFDEAESQPRRHDPERMTAITLSCLGGRGCQVGEERVSHSSAQDGPDPDPDPDTDTDFDL